MPQQFNSASTPISSLAESRQTDACLAAQGLGSWYTQASDPADGPCLGRVTCRQANRYQIITRHGQLEAEVSGRLSYAAVSESDLPVVGDWVLAWWDNPANPHDLGMILELCPRQSELRRLAPGGSGAVQVLASNVQQLLVVWPLDRVDAATHTRWGLVQRFLTMARDGGIKPVLVLNKADLLSPESGIKMVEQARQRWPGLPVLLLQSRDSLKDAGPAASNLACHQELLSLLAPASSSVLVGLSGAGKSTLLNDLCGTELAQVQAIRQADHKGRHTTTHRELHTLPNGALVIDSPGIRELGLAGDAGSLDDSFSVLAELATACRFADCLHGNEPGCAVRRAIESGELPADVLAQYRKQRDELARLAARQIKASHNSASWREFQDATSEQRKWKSINKSMRGFNKEQRSRG